MATRQIRLFPDAVLSTPCHPVHDFGISLQNLIKDLSDTMNASPGVGLAAPQIGVSLRVSVIDVARRSSKPPKSYHGFIVLINPVLIEGNGQQTPREGCLSVPDYLANIQRFETVTVQTFDPQGQKHVFKSSGFEALALQHEIDHLEGRLFLDRISNLKTDLFRRKSYHS